MTSSCQQGWVCIRSRMTWPTTWDQNSNSGFCISNSKMTLKLSDMTFTLRLKRIYCKYSSIRNRSFFMQKYDSFMAVEKESAGEEVFHSADEKNFRVEGLDIHLSGSGFRRLPEASELPP